MIKFDLTRLWPKFILRDKNGYAMAKALEAGLKYFLDRCQEGLDCVLDPDKMPEWRLDQMAWELNSLYDYTATVEAKREWIKNAIPLYSIWGTPQSMVDYLSGYFDAVELEEYWQYNGDPYHFRVTLTGVWTAENEAWARRAIETAKNVRSVMDTLAAGSGATILVSGAIDGVYRFTYPMTGMLEAGTWPQESVIGIVDAGGAEIGAAADAQKFPYTMTGTVPYEATIGALMEAAATVDGRAEGVQFPYPMTSEDAQAGTRPEIATQGVIASGGANVQAEDAAFAIEYKMCGDDDLM